MATSLLQTSSSQRLDQTDLAFLAQDQPTAMQSSVLGVFASSANASQSLWILYGFGATAGVGSTSTSPAQNQLQIASGSGIMAWRRDAGTPRFGQMADLDGSGQPTQSLDFTYMPSGQYIVWLRMTYTPGAQTDRTFWNSASDGFEYSKLTPVRLTVTWEIQALANGSSPGPEWVSVAQLTWTAPSSQGGVGSLNNLQDIRPLYFEGKASSSPAFASSWGSSQDRSANRSVAGVRDLRTMLDALKTGLEDLKGPGLRRWWDPGMGGVNVGFVPNTPVERRVAVGDTGLFLQGRTASAPNDAFLCLRGDGSTPNINGIHVQSDRIRWLNGSTTAPMWTISTYGTMGFGNLAETDLYAGPGRALVEMVTSATGQDALRLGARAVNGASPALIPTVLHLIAPDQTGNVAQVCFSRGGVQGPEQRLYYAGKGNNNNFNIFDAVNSYTFFDYSYVTRSTLLSGQSFAFFDTANSRTALSYDSGSGVIGLNSAVNVTGALTTTSISGSSLSMTGTISSGLSVTSASSMSTARFVVTASQAQLAADRLVLPVRSSAPTSPVVGTVYYDSSKGNIYIYTQQGINNGNNDDGVGLGWRRI